ncbi:MAG TPA: AmmeMemoRadiSam system protein B, partial [Acidobacteriota bacterium]|nr:AmmeMemoRadiSam system protein B [Acidobacteriota bacterium]
MPAVAGRFYPGSRQALLTDLDRYTVAADKRLAARGIVAPHAGYMYSGAVAGAVFG